MKEKVSSKA